MYCRYFFAPNCNTTWFFWSPWGVLSILFAMVISKAVHPGFGFGRRGNDQLGWFGLNATW
jgi:hypothetical protein